MRIIICGSRNWYHRQPIHDEIDRLYQRYGSRLVIIHGAARGADTIAGDYAQHLRIAVEAYPADWSKGKAAGPLRNQQMLDTGIDGVVAFDMGGSGTADMMRRAKAAGVPVIRYTQQHSAFYRVDWTKGVFG